MPTCSADSSANKHAIASADSASRTGLTLTAPASTESPMWFRIMNPPVPTPSSHWKPPSKFIFRTSCWGRCQTWHGIDDLDGLHTTSSMSPIVLFTAQTAPMHEGINSPALALFLTSHHLCRKVHTLRHWSFFKFRIVRTNSLDVGEPSGRFRTSSNWSSLQHLRTCLHFRKQWPPSSSRRQQTGHLVSKSIWRLLIFSLKAKLLCAILQSKCLILGGHFSRHILFHRSSLEPLPPLLDVSPCCVWQLCSTRPSRTWYADFTEKQPFWSKCQAIVSSWFGLIGIARMFSASSPQKMSLTKSWSHSLVNGSINLETLVRRVGLSS